MMNLDRAAQLEYILDHYQNPHNHGEMEGADVHLQGGLPGCSDLITLYLKFAGERIVDISFVGEGCTISQASASMLTDEVKGMSIDQALKLDHQFISELMGEEVVHTRPRCATLGLDTLRAAIYEYQRQQPQG